MKALELNEIQEKAKFFANMYHLTWNDNEVSTSIINLFKDNGWVGKLFIDSLIKNEGGERLNSIIDYILKISPSLEKNIHFISQIIKHDKIFLEKFPTYQHHHAVILAVLAKNPQCIVDYKDWITQPLLAKAIAYNPLVYRFIPKKYKNNKQLALIALKSNILYQINENDKKCGVFFDIPQTLRNNKKIIITALKTYPYIYSLLPDKYKINEKITLEMLKSIFYEKDSSYYHILSDIVPLISPQYFKKIKNIFWIIQAFEDNLDNIYLNAECTMKNLVIILKLCCEENNEFNVFSKHFKLDMEVENMIHYNNQEQELLNDKIESFFKYDLLNIAKKFQNFNLYQHLNNIIPVHKDTKKLKKI